MKTMKALAGALVAIIGLAVADVSAHAQAVPPQTVTVCTAPPAGFACVAGAIVALGVGSNKEAMKQLNDGKPVDAVVTAVRDGGQHVERQVKDGAQKAEREVKRFFNCLFGC